MSLIASQAIRPGDVLPAERTLAQQLAVSRTTVTAAYLTLRGVGLIASRQGSGSVITDLRPSGHDPMAALLAGNPLLPGPAAEPDEPDRHRRIDLSVCRGDAGLDLEQFLAPAFAIAKAARFDVFGLTALRTAVAEHLTNDGLKTDPTQLMITTGSQQGLTLVASDLHRNDRVLVEDPTYFGALHAYGVRQAKMVPIPRQDLATNPGSLATAIKSGRIELIHLTPSVHNPCGDTLSELACRRIVEEAATGGIRVVDDTSLRPLTNRPSPYLAAIAPPSATVITIGSFSKIVWQGLRVGWLRAPRSIIERLSRRKAAADLATPPLDQALALMCLPQYTEIVQTRQRDLARGRLTLVTAMSELLPSWEFPPLGEGPFLWVRTPLDDATPLVQRADRGGVRLTPGRVLSSSGNLDGYVRIAHDAPAHDLRLAIERLADIAAAK